MPFPLICHSQDAPPTEHAMIMKIFDYVDRLFAIVRPRKLLFIAIGMCLFGADLSLKTNKHAL